MATELSSSREEKTPIPPAAIDDATELLSRGLSLFPVPRPRPGAAAGQPGDGKVPALPWREYQSRLPTADELATWFRTPQNIAVVTGAVSGVVVVDADAMDAVRWAVRRLPYTPWQTKTPRGFHLWYRHPGVRVGNRARIATEAGKLSMDVRGDGGYVIAPGSLHASGAVYEWAGDWSQPQSEVPIFWPGWLERPPAAPSRSERAANTKTPGTVSSIDTVTRARAYLAAIPKPEIGNGSDEATFYAACRLVRRFELAAADAEALLWEWAGGRDGWDREWIAAKVAHAERYGTEPRGA